MRNLREGVDMMTVRRAVILSEINADMLTVYGNLHVKSPARSDDTFLLIKA